MASNEVTEFLNRMDPDLQELSDLPGFEETAQGIYDLSKEEAEKLYRKDRNGNLQVDVERIAFLLTMQSEAINRLVDEIEALRPSIRFITSVLLGNQSEETDER